MAYMAVLSYEECLDLLRHEEVGRVAVATPVGPRILPVHYTVHGQHVFFRTTPNSALGIHGNGIDLAMEIDSLDYDTHQGWSVVVVGPATRVEDPDDVQAIHRGWGPVPWADGTRFLYVRLAMRELSGRRLVSQPGRKPRAPV
jgi:uncharacterized protein